MKRKNIGIVLLVTLMLLLSSFIPVLGASSTTSTSAANKTALTIQEAMQIGTAVSNDLKVSILEVTRANENRDDAAENVTYIPYGGMVVPSYQSVWNGYQQAQIGVTTAQKTEQATRDQVVTDVVGNYAAAVKAYDDMQTAKINLDKAKQQMRIAEISSKLGMVSSYDMKAYEDAITKLDTAFKAGQASYKAAVASLGNLLGVKDPNWNPKLTSAPNVSNYKRDELSVEITRGTDESIAVWAKKAAMDIELSKEPWVITSVNDTVKKINRDEAVANYQQATVDIAASIKSLYYTIDALQESVAMKDKALIKAQEDLKIAKIKYDAGLIPMYTASTGDCLYNYEKAVELAMLALDAAKADLAKQKANFAMLTGQSKEVYSAADWK